MLGNIQGKLVESAARCIQILRMLLHVACMHLHTHVRASLDVDAQAPTCSRCMAGAVDQDEHQDSAKSKSVYSVLVALSSRNFHINGPQGLCVVVSFGSMSAYVGVCVCVCVAYLCET